MVELGTAELGSYVPWNDLGLYACGGAGVEVIDADVPDIGYGPYDANAYAGPASVDGLANDDLFLSGLLGSLDPDIGYGAYEQPADKHRLNPNPNPNPDDGDITVELPRMRGAARGGENDRPATDGRRTARSGGGPPPPPPRGNWPVASFPDDEPTGEEPSEDEYVPAHAERTRTQAPAELPKIRSETHSAPATETAVAAFPSAGTSRAQITASTEERFDELQRCLTGARVAFAAYEHIKPQFADASAPTPEARQAHPESPADSTTAVADVPVMPVRRPAEALRAVEPSLLEEYDGPRPGTEFSDDIDILKRIRRGLGRL